MYNAAIHSRRRCSVEAEHSFDAKWLSNDFRQVLLVDRAARGGREEPFGNARTVKDVASGARQRSEVFTWLHCPKANGTRIVVASISEAVHPLANGPKLLLREMRLGFREEKQQIVVLGLNLSCLKGLITSRFESEEEISTRSFRWST